MQAPGALLYAENEKRIFGQCNDCILSPSIFYLPKYFVLYSVLVRPTVFLNTLKNV